MIQDSSIHFSPRRGAPRGRVFGQSIVSVMCSPCFDASLPSVQAIYEVCERDCGSTAHDCERGLSGGCQAPEVAWDDPIDDVVSLADAADMESPYVGMAIDMQEAA